MVLLPATSSRSRHHCSSAIADTVCWLCAVLPMNHSVNRVDLSYQSNSNRLQKLTLANIPKGSQLYW